MTKNYERRYAIIVDGFEIKQVTLDFDEYKNEQAKRETLKRIAAHYKMPDHLFKLKRLDDKYIYWTDMQTGKTKRKKVVD